MQESSSLRSTSPAARRLRTEIVRAWPALTVLAALHFGALLAVPLALLTVGERWLVALPLAGGALVEAARLWIRQRLRRALRQRCLEDAARNALDKVVPVPEANVDSAFWAAHMTEYAVAADVPAIAGALLANLVILVVAWLRLGAEVAGPVTAILVLGAALSLWSNRRRTRAVDAIVERREQTASWMAAAERDFGEIHGEAARAPYLRTLSQRVQAWCDAEAVLERRWFVHRLVVGAVVVSGFLVVALSQGINPLELSWEASLTVRGVADLLLLATSLPVGAVLTTHADSLLVVLAALKKTQLPEASKRPAARTITGRPRRLSVRALTFHYGSQLALDIDGLDVDLTAPCLLKGPNGAGKTTLGALASGVFVPTRGAIEIDGVPCSELDPDQLAFVPQNPLIVETFSIAENVHLVAPKARASDIRERLLALGLDRPLDAPAGHLSKGEQRRIALARALLKEPAVLVLDEPDAWLDAEGRRILLEILKVEARSRAVILISHRAELGASGFETVALGADHRLTPLEEPRARAGTARP